MLTRFSYSALDSFKTCPKKFQFQYLIKPDVKDDQVSAILYLGSAVHRVLNKLYTLAADKIVLPKEEMVKLYNEDWSKIKPEKFIVSNEYYAVDDYIRIGREMLIDYYDTFTPFDQAKLLGSEEKMSYKLPGTDFSFSCILDRVSKKDDGSIEICDYKTGEHITRPNDPRFFFQMGLYQLAYQQNYPQYDKFELSQYFLRKKEKVTLTLAPEQIDMLTEDLKLAALEIQHAERLKQFPTSEGNHCLWCDYAELCPAKRHRWLLEQEEEAENAEVYTTQKLKELAEEYIQTDDQIKELKAKLEQLRTQLVEAKEQTNIEKFESDLGYVKLSQSVTEKFITKTDSQEEFLKLWMLCRDNNLDEFYTIDASALYKEGYKKGHLSPELLSELEKYLKTVETKRFNIKRIQKDDLKDD